MIGEPGALPIFQYALTELFDRRDGDVLTAAAYRAMGGARGALSRRADDLYHRLTLDEQEAARQLFLRLATITDDNEWGRRRVPASEIVSIDVDVVTMGAVIDRFGRHRFLSFDRDHGTGAPTLEVAHEALLWEWERLRGWIEDGRQDVKRRAALNAAISEWEQAAGDGDYLLAGNRLAEYERWRAATSMRMSASEQDFLDASVARRDAGAASETERAAREAKLGRRARRRWWGLVAAAAILAFVAVAVYVVGPDTTPSVALLSGGRGGRDLDDLVVDGFDRAAREFDIDTSEINTTSSDITTELVSVAESGFDLIAIHGSADLARYIDSTIATRYPDTTWAYIDVVVPGAPSIVFAEQEGSFLVGAAAALTSETGTIGFVGGFQTATVERFRAGFEAGARAVDRSIEVLAGYVALDGSGFDRGDLAGSVAAGMYERGADVVFHAAGQAGFGVIATARDESAALGRHVWAIGVDADQYHSVDPGERPFVLTSMIKKFDVAVYELVRRFLEDELDPDVRVLGLAENAVGYSTTGDKLSLATIAELEGYRAEIVAGTLAVPEAPNGTLEPPPGTTVGRTLTVTYDGTVCDYEGPTEIERAVVRIEFVNHSDADAWVTMRYTNELRVEVPARAGGTNTGFASMEVARRYAIECNAESGIVVAGPTLHAIVG